MNSFMNNLKNATNFKLTENGAIAHKSTNSAIYDMFALCGAYRKRSDADCILMFKNAIEENEALALKCLFYLRDVRGGQGERRFFRVCFKWLCNNYPEAAKRNLDKVAEYGRWDDMLYAAADTQLEDYCLFLLKEQLALDLECKTPSLLGKWLPSENASSYETFKMASKVRKYLKMTHKQYRKVLSTLRQRINIVERLMSENRWDEIEFDKIPSKAGLIYKNAFARRDLIAKKYETFVKDETKTVNAKTLFPYEIVKKVTDTLDYWGRSKGLSDVDKMAIEKYWNNQKDYFNGADCNIMCVVDTSGSMTSSNGSVAPRDVAISLGMYCAERNRGAFKDHYISFSSVPQLIKIEGIDFADKVERIYKTNLCQDTNLTATFDLLKNIALQSNKEDIPSTIVVISDMEINCGSNWSTSRATTEMERVRQEWAAVGLTMPNLVYWNVDARDNTILDLGPNVSLVSGCSPVIFEQVIRGLKGVDLMLEKLMSERYAAIN